MNEGFSWMRDGFVCLEGGERLFGWGREVYVWMGGGVFVWIGEGSVCLNERESGAGIAGYILFTALVRLGRLYSVSQSGDALVGCLGGHVASSVFTHFNGSHQATAGS